MVTVMIKQISVYQLVDSRSFGGIESHILHLSNWLQTQGVHNSVIFLQDHGPHPLKQALRSHGIDYHCIAHPLKLFKLLQQGPSLLCTHGYKAGILGRLSACLSKTPVISTYHSGDDGVGKVKLYSLLDRYSAFLADNVISVSREISRKLPVAAANIVNFIPQQTIQPQRGKAVAFVGRLSHEKDPLCFARATRGLDIPCHIYGDGPLKVTLRDNFQHAQLFGHVDMHKHWSGIGLLCITSHFEGLPLVALEAMSRGIPVISFAIGGLPELIIEAKNGWLIDNRDESDLRAAIQHWVALPETEKTTLSLFAHLHIQQHYCDEQVCPQVLALYEKTLKQRPISQVKA